ncbi:MAG: UDP-3-O-(3-hydroxymyristoyl)glucosamine N-acyltransferase [Mogibacterium sp.]|nr:UDP-3-O-(3-hydroxymyristoyl)glucosamine N-acyltransferase [Mogibacterium sp.]
MLLSKELSRIGIGCSCYAEKNFDSLGLAGYNDGKNVCTFLAAANYATGLSDGINMILTSQSVYDELKGADRLLGNYGICIVENPRLTYFLLHNALCDSKHYARKQYPTQIAESAQISPLALIAPNNVNIGENTVIEEFVSVKENTVIGNDCVIRAGTKIGGPGFEIKNDGEKTITVKHIGGVRIGKNVEIQQNSNVDKAIYPWDDTVIEDHVRINSLVQIAHGDKIGRYTEIVAGTSIQGRVQIGENVWIGPNSVIRNGLTIGNNARVNMGAVVTLSVPSGHAVSGNFARDHGTLIEEMKKYK